MIVALPLFVPALALIVAEPGATAVTTPDDDTVATPALLVVHVTGRSVTTVPFASRTVAASTVVCATNRFADVGVTLTLPTGTAATDTSAFPLLPSLVAVIVAEPTESAVTTPAAVTVATASLLDVQLTGRSVTTTPRLSLTVAASVTVCPTISALFAG